MFAIIDSHKSFGSLRIDVPGSIYMLRCTKCHRTAALPVELLARRYLPETRVSEAISKLECSQCHQRAGEVVLARLCEPGCRHQRG